MAALIVFFGHVRGSSFVEYGALPTESKNTLTAIFFGLTRLGHEAVIVFFVLSGFLVGGQVIRHLKERRFDVISYCIERSTRIFLPLVPACLLTAALGLASLQPIPNWPTLLSNMIGLNGVITPTLNGNAPLWTLAYEIWFYILAGAVAHYFSSRRSRPATFFVIGYSVCVFSILAAHYLLIWCAGAIVVLMLGLSARRSMAIVGVFLAVLGVAAYQLGFESKSFVNVTYLPPAISEVLVCIGICLTIPLLCADRTDAALRYLRGPASYLSSMSYTLYLMHYPLNVALDPFFQKSIDLSWPAIGMFVLRVVLLLLCIRVLYWAFESRTPKLRRWLKNRLSVSAT